MLLPQTSDGVLLQRMQTGDESAFAALFHRYWDRLYMAAAKRLGDAQEAQDLVQNIMETLWRKRDTLVNGANGTLEAYLFTLLKYHVLTTIAATNKQEICYHVFTQLVTLQESHVLEDLLSKELQAAIDQEIASMPANMQKVITLSQRQGFSNKQIAASLSLSEGTVRNLLSQGVGRIRTCIRHYYKEMPHHAHQAFVLFTLTVAGF